MKHLKLLLLISVFLLCGCASNENTLSLEDDIVSTSQTTRIPTPTPAVQLVTYTDGAISYTFNKSVLKHASSSSTDNLLYGVSFSSIDTDVATAIENGSYLSIATMRFSSSEQRNSLQQYPKEAVTALFNGVFDVSDSSATVSVSDDIYEYETTKDGFICRAKFLTFDDDSFTTLFCRVSESETKELLNAFDDLYNSIAFNPDYASSGNNESSENIVAKTATSTPAGKYETVKSNSWSSVANYYPFVSYDDISKGGYAGQYVILSATLDSIEYVDSMNWVQCNAWFLHEDSYVACNVTFQCDELSEYSPKLLQSGDNIDICFFINSDNSFGSNIKAFNKNDNQVSLEEIYNSFKQNCVPMNQEDVMRNPDTFYGTAFSFTGNVFQIISDESNFVELLLSTGADDEYIYVSYSYKNGDSKILEDDTLTVYGTFYKLYKYTSVLGTRHSIPSIVAEFIE